MSNERRRSRESLRRTVDWTARILGATSLVTAAMLLAPAKEMDSATASFNTSVTAEPAPEPVIEQPAPSPLYDARTGLTRDTGMDAQSCYDFKVCGTDVGQPFLLPNGSVGYLFGDTFAIAGPFVKDSPPGADQYRAQAMLRSNVTPEKGEPIIFDSAAGLDGKGVAPETLGQWHILLNDGVSLPNGDIVVSYQHTIAVDNPDASWYTDYSGLAVSHDGNTFELAGPIWKNDTENNLDPYQMWSMQRDGDYVYIVSVRTGRRPGPMMLFRARWDQMLQKNGYEYWNGTSWGEKANAKPLQTGHFGEPSLRKLSDGTWVISYADYYGGPKIVTRTLLDPSTGPAGQWSAPKVQLTGSDLPNLYGGGIHPYSTADNPILMVSTWQTKGESKDIHDRELVRYDVSHLNTTA